MKTLEEKISDLKKEHEIGLISAEFETEMEALFPDMKTLAYANDWKGIQKTLNIEPLSNKQFQEVLKKLPPTNGKTVIGYAGKDDTILKTPYRLDLINPCQTGRFSSFKMKVDYQSNDINLRIKVPIALVQNFVMRSSRNITSSEYHYFTGVSQAELNRMKVTQYTWNTNDYIGWYGGNKTLTDIYIINEVINYLNN